MKYLISFLVFIPLLSNGQISNEKALLIYNKETATITWVNYNGELVKELTSNQIPHVKGGKPQTISQVFDRSNFAIHNFAAGPLSLYENASWQLYNSSGSKVASLNSDYLELSDPEEGIFIATLKDSNGRKVQKYVNEDGSELFNSIEFSQATNFRNDTAFAQKDSIWFVLSSEFKTITPLPIKNEFKILSIQRNTRKLSLAVIETRDGQAKILIDNSGHPIFSPIACGTSRTSNIACVDDQVFICTNQHKAFIYDSTAKLSLELDSVISLGGIGDQLMLFIMSDGKKRLFDYQGNEVILQLPNGYKYEVVNISTRIIWALVIIPGEEFKINAVFDGVSRKLVFQTKGDIIGGFLGDRILFSEWEGGYKYLKALSTIDGKILYLHHYPKEDYNILLARYLPKEEVTSVNVDEDQGLELLKNFSSIKNIQFRFCTFKLIPQVLCNFKNVEKLALVGCDQLLELPGCINQLPKLEKLQITHCNKLTGVENLLRVRTKALTVLTVGYQFEEGFREFIKAEKSFIKIDAWSGINTIKSN